jgi:hypothetical protein
MDSKKKLFEIHFLLNGQIKMFNFDRKTSEISTFSSHEKIPGWIKDNMNSVEVLKIVDKKRRKG